MWYFKVRLKYLAYFKQDKIAVYYYTYTAIWK